MVNLNDKKLAVFFTRGISLADWAKIGNLSRELRMYLELKKKLKEVYLFTYGNFNDADYLGEFKDCFRVFPKKNNLPNWLYSFLLPFFYRKELREVDILKTNQMDGAWAAVLAKMFFRKKLIVRCGYEWFFTVQQKKMHKIFLWIYFLLEKFVYNFADNIILTSSAIREFVVKYFKSVESKIVVMPNYVDIDIFKPNPDIVSDANRLICVGRLEKEKNLFLLFKALENLEIKLFVFGNGSLKNELHQYVKSIKGLEVNFIDNIKNNLLPLELNKSSIFLQLSDYEGSPKTILEAMSCALPVVVTNVVGINEVVTDGDTGILCEKSEHAVREAVIKLLEDEKLRKIIGEQARKEIVENYSLQKSVDQELDIYKNLLC